MSVPVVLVHGNPETPAIWRPLVASLSRSGIHTPQLPGFGTPVPAGFGATQREYVGWLIGELEAIGEPVHLVGHDWGGGLVVPVACERPDLLVSWTTDVMGLFDVDYVWHDMAQVWQTPGAGEEAVGALADMALAERVGLMAGLGMPADVAADVGAALNAEMGACILSLYRSAAQPVLRNQGERLAHAAQRPGLAIVPTEDPYTGGVALASRAAAAAGAQVEVLDGLGHWWMLQDPGRGAALLESFWTGCAEDS